MNEEKQLPSTELSLKYMAWDIKKIKESLELMKGIEEQLRLIAKNIDTFVQAYRSNLPPSDQMPF